jgi:DNA modification methylase
VIDPYVDIYQGNCLDIMAGLPADSAQCVVTSPPYWGLRKYDGDQDYIWGNHNDCEHEWSKETVKAEGFAGAGVTHGGGTFNPRENGGILKYHIERNSCPKCGAWKGAFGLEPTVDMYVEHTIEILRALRRVLKPDGIIWWNIGDSYTSGKGTCHNPGGNISTLLAQGLKPKDLCLVPFRVVLAAQADGWWVRSIIIWSKPNAMPESVKDRPTESHEYILMLTKSQRYYFDMEAVRETQTGNAHSRGDEEGNAAYQESRGSYKGFASPSVEVPGGRNIRSVWKITTQPFKGAHFATFPEEIPRRCILASTSEKGNCIKCGRPWVRITAPGPGQPESWKGSRFDDGKYLEVHPNVGRREDAKTDTQYAEGSTAKRLALLRQQARENGGEYSNENITTDWKPSCKCDAEVTKPIVLDPFGGSGTVPKVAKELGRKSIYIDTSEKYCEMARKRIQLVTPPMEIT